MRYEYVHVHRSHLYCRVYMYMQVKSLRAQSGYSNNKHLILAMSPVRIKALRQSKNILHGCTANI